MKMQDMMKQVYHMLPYTLRCKLMLGVHTSDYKTTTNEAIQNISKIYSDGDEEIQTIISYIKKMKRIETFNGDWTQKYKNKKIDIELDEEGWPYYIVAQLSRQKSKIFIMN